MVLSADVAKSSFPVAGRMGGTGGLVEVWSCVATMAYPRWLPSVISAVS